MKISKLCMMGLLLYCSFSINVYADTKNDHIKNKTLNLTPVFVSLSDAMGAVKNHDTDQAKKDLSLIENQLNHINQDQSRQSELLKETYLALNHAKINPNDENLKALSIKLYAYEKEQNPVDYRDKRREFAKRIMPVLDDLEQAIDNFKKNNNIDDVKSSYDKFNKTWISNERVVRNTSMAHYGKIETAMAMIRVGMENSQPNINMMKENIKVLSKTIDGYNRGDELKEREVNHGKNIDLAYGITLLQEGLDALQNNRQQIAQAKLGEFIRIWAVIEADVRTRNAKLYTDIESQIPVIMAKGDKVAQDDLANLIIQLQAINPHARYSWVDSMFILLREGLEALLIIMALMTALTVAKQTKGKKWVIAGVGTGLMSSLVGAWVLANLFPSLTSGANREMLEGVVGIVAVVMMIGVGAWLHSKSSIKAWNAYIDKHMGMTLSTGSVAGLFGLSFLSVFREGAETILFYVGILPSIAMGDFVMGIVAAVIILGVVAIVMMKTSLKLPIPMLFKILTIAIYLLGFKILGVSILALQLTNHLPNDVINLPAMSWIGFYPSLQGLGVQGVYVVVILLILMGMTKRA